MRLYVIDPSPFRNPVLSVADQFGNFVDVADVLSSLVAIVAQDDAFPDWSFDELIHEQQHDPEVVEGLADELLALLEGKQVFEGVLHEDSTLYFVDEVVEGFVVGADG